LRAETMKLSMKKYFFLLLNANILKIDRTNHQKKKISEKKGRT